MKQLKIDKKKCVACAACSSFGELIQFDDEGYAQVKNEGIYDEELQCKAKESVSQCPQNAITIGNYKSKANISTLDELIVFVKKNLENYSLPKITEDDLVIPLMKNGDYSFISVHLPDLSGKIFKSERKAINAGKDELSHTINGPLKTRIRELLTSFKTGPLNKYRIYEEVDGNYYYDRINDAKKVLKQISLEIKNLYNVTLTDDLLNIKSTAVWYNDSSNKNSALDYLEDRLIRIAMDNVESPSWYYSWLDADGYEKIWTLSDLSANEKIAEHAWSGLEDATSYREIFPIVEETISTFKNNLEKEMREKCKEILNFIENVKSKSSIN